MSVHPDQLVGLMPGPNELPGVGNISAPAAGAGIPMPTAAGIPLPTAAKNAAGQANGGGLTGVQPVAATMAATTAGGQSNVQFAVPPSTGTAQITGATPTQQGHSPVATNTIAGGTNAAQQQRGQHVMSGIQRAINASKEAIDNPATIRGELAWQPGATETAARTPFKAQLLSQMGFRCMAFMRPNSNYIQVVHSMANCFLPGGSAEFLNKDFGFLGDMSGFMSPQPVLMSKEKPWKWERQKVIMDAVAMDTHYNQATGENTKKLWYPPDKTKSIHHTAPRMLLIPSNLIEFLTSTPRTPWELYTHVAGLVAAPGSQWTNIEWKFITDWCIMATQVDTSGSSWLAFEFDGGASGDPMFQQWCSNRLSLTLEVNKEQSVPQAAHATHNGNQQLDMTQMAQLMSAAAGHAVGVAVAAMRQVNPTTTSTPTKGEGAGKHYEDFDIAAIKGFCGVTEVLDMADIWGYFQTTKSSKEHRNMIMTRMKKWAQENSFKIDPAIFFPLSIVEDIVSLSLNPGECIANFGSIDKGLTPMACRPRSAAAVEVIKAREQAKEASGSNRTFDEALKLNKSDPTTPPANYEDLCRIFVAYTALTFALWGEGNDLYKTLFWIIIMLYSDPVQMERHNFTGPLCDQATWALCEDIRNFYGSPMTPDNFSSGKRLVFPTSTLADISSNLRHQEEFHRRSFPSQWLYNATGTLPVVSMTGSQYGSGSFIQPLPSGGGGLTFPRVIPVGNTDEMSGLTTLNPPVPSGASPYTKTSTAGEAPRKIKGLNPDTHPTIAAVTMPWLQKSGRLTLNKAMRAGGCKWEQMPVIEKYVTGGENNLCYNYVLGVCDGFGTKGKCERIHPKREEVTDTFAMNLIRLTKSGFDALMSAPFKSGGGSKRKAGGQ